LPVSAFEAEVRSYAEALIRQWHRQKNNPWGPSSLLSAEGSSEFLLWWFRSWMMRTPEGRMDLEKMARSGVAEADAVLRSYLLFAKSHHVEPYGELLSYDMDITAGRLSPSHRGEKSTKRLIRDLLIMLTVEAVRDRYGLPIEPRSKQLTACEVVADALREAKIGMGASNVRRAWEKFKGATPTAPRGWSHDMLVSP
jgi:hypothetical protein